MSGSSRRVELWRAAVFAAALLFCAPARAAEDTFLVGWRADQRETNRVFVEVSGISAAALKKLRSYPANAPELRRLLSVYIHQDTAVIDPFAPGMAGTHVIEENTLRFLPQFPLERGIAYRAEFRPALLPDKRREPRTITATFRLDKANLPSATIVKQVYPSADLLPENLLKFYIYFTAPMSRGGIYDYISLREESGREVELPFLQIDEELWDAEMKRLTLFIDPGRIKREVQPLEEVGPALVAGKKYQLAIVRQWKDATGNPLKENFVKRFTVGPPDREALDPKQWKVTAPNAGGRDSLLVDFGGPLDHALALRMIEVRSAMGEEIAGSKTLGNNERRWLFTPEKAWAAGDYAIAVQTTIEDLAGNNIGKQFEVDLFEGVQRRFTNAVMKIPFSIR